MAFLENYVSREVTTADVVSATGLGTGRLRVGLRRAVGMLSMAYLRSARLPRVRSEQRFGDDPIDEVAAHWRFYRAGRFASPYRERFGELSSALRARTPGR